MKMVIISEEDFAKLGKEERKIELMKIKRQEEVVKTIYHEPANFLEKYLEIHRQLSEAEGRE